MPIEKLEIKGYRSIQDLFLRPEQINVVLGPNGSGKTNIYKSIQLLSKLATGEFAKTIAYEGGMPSVLWAGSRGKKSPRLKIGVTLKKLKYEIECGIEPKHYVDTYFRLEPEIKNEKVFFESGKKSTVLINRRQMAADARDREGKKILIKDLLSNESILSTIKDPFDFPEVAGLHNELSSWRFYHNFRTDAESSLRRPQVGFRTVKLSNDGSDLASALATIDEIGSSVVMQDLIAYAFPGSELLIETEGSMFHLKMRFPGMKRYLDASELSDGTLQFLCLLAALLSPRPPSLIALNEPEGSLHHDLMKPLAILLAEAAETTQIWLTTHSLELATEVELLTGVQPIELEKVAGETRVVGSSNL